MPTFRAAKPRSVVGLDIEPSHLAAAEVRSNGSLTIERAATAPLAPGAMRDGEVVDVEALGQALGAFFDAHKLGRRVRLGVANQRIVVRTLELPRIDDDKELAAAVRFQAQDLIPMPLEQAVLDFKRLGDVDAGAGQRTRVVLVAARRDMIDRLIAAARHAGLRPEGIDLAAFAMVRALDDGSSPDGTAALYVNLGGMTNMAVAQAGMCHFTRVVAGGADGIVADLAERRGLTLDHSRQWLVHVGLEQPLEVLDGDPEIVADARAVLADGARRVADEVRNTLDFYRGQDGSLHVGRAVLTGPTVHIPGFPEQLAADLGMPLEPGVVSEAEAGALAGVEPGRLTVAAGLAVEDRS